MQVLQSTFNLLIGLIPVVLSIAVIVGGAIYYNRTKTNKLYQRLFGLDEDEMDTGYMNKMHNKLDVMDEKLDELNHQRIQDLEVQLETVQNEIGELNKRLTEEERSDDTEE